MIFIQEIKFINTFLNYYLNIFNNGLILFSPAFKIIDLNLSLNLLNMRNKSIQFPFRSHLLVQRFDKCFNF